MIAGCVPLCSRRAQPTSRTASRLLEHCRRRRRQSTRRGPLPLWPRPCALPVDWWIPDGASLHEAGGAWHGIISPMARDRGRHPFSIRCRFIVSTLQIHCQPLERFRYSKSNSGQDAHRTSALVIRNCLHEPSFSRKATSCDGRHCGEFPVKISRHHNTRPGRNDRGGHSKENDHDYDDLGRAVDA